MQFRPLGASGLLVSPICLGTMTYGSPVGEDEAIRLTHHAIDVGINFIDTSSLIVGVKNSEQIQSAITAVDSVIPAEHLTKLNAVCQPPWQFPDPVRGNS